ncbi:MAG: hypothetical protein IKK40_05330 [Bacteroidales bacterium]|nr:hypothetical protein [Bacteroidales bacterium]MBR6265877.1 hypothetical protein [Bacteroidales bacterium]
MKKIFIICSFSFLTLLFGCNTDKIQEKLGYVTKSDVDSLMSGMSQKIDSLSQLVVCLVQDADNKKKDTRPLFSVSASDRVFFSKGNLQYQPINGIWRFAENQYDVIGQDNEKISPKYTGWIDLFGWGTSGWKDAAKPSDVSPDYKNYFVGGGNTNSLTGFYAQGDWGVFNRISNGGNVEGRWRTLTFDEWDYLLFKRNRASQLNYHAQIDSVNGLVLLPDNWAKEPETGFRQYTVEEWSALETDGAVFLPEAGFRQVRNVLGVNSYGLYWASTAGEFGAVYIQIDTASVSVCGSYRGSGRSVRLVRPLEE